MAGKKLNVTELDFDVIKQNIKDYYKRDGGPYKDWDFEGSGLNHLLDILAYNTHYNAILAHLAANESFIGSAQLRKNVVARAKTLGYLPRSFTAATTKIRLSGADVGSLATVPKNTVFSTSVGGNSYDFITLNAVTGTFGATGDQIEVKQGTLRTVQYTYDNSDTNRRYEIPDSKVDVSTLRVTAFPHGNSSSSTLYTKFTELSNVTASTDIYFVFENPNGFFEIEFGNNVIGKKPASGSVISIEYLSTDGAAANGATTFNLKNTLTDSGGSALNNIVVSGADISSGGGDRESIEEIRFNAPLSFTSQDRAVTVDDYKAQILNASDATAVSVWGGEDNDPVDLGAVYISAKQADNAVLTDSQKGDLRKLLRDKGVLTLRHEFVDPKFIYIYFDIFSKFNPSLTTLNADTLGAKIATTVSNFDANALIEYNSIFRFSKFLSEIDNTSPAVLSTAARVYAYRKLELNQKLFDTDTSTVKVVDLSGRDAVQEWRSNRFFPEDDLFFFGNNVYRVTKSGQTGTNAPNSSADGTSGTLEYSFEGSFSETALTDQEKKLLSFDFTFALDEEETDIVYSKETATDNFKISGVIYRFGTQKLDNLPSHIVALTIYQTDEGKRSHLTTKTETASIFYGLVNVSTGVVYLGKPAAELAGVANKRGAAFVPGKEYRVGDIFHINNYVYEVTAAVDGEDDDSTATSGTTTPPNSKDEGLVSGEITYKFVREYINIQKLPTIDDADVNNPKVINLYTRPASNDIAAKRNTVIEIDDTLTSITAEIDDAALRGNNSAIKDYVTHNRDKDIT